MNNRNLLPVLLLFLALLFAWGVYSNNIGRGDVGTPIEQQYGIGGAPPTPTAVELRPTIEEMIEDNTILE